MKKFVVSCLLIGIVSCSVSPKKLDELNSENNYYSPAQTIKCMQMQTPQRPHPINKKGEVRESYDQGDCYDDLLTKNMSFREFGLKLANEHSQHFKTDKRYENLFFEEAAKASLKKQEEIDSQNEPDFEVFLKEYFSQTS